MKKIFVLTGEPSGDKLASTVISKLKIKHPKIFNKNINILKVENDLSLLIETENKRLNIFFGELI